MKEGRIEALLVSLQRWSISFDVATSVIHTFLNVVTDGWLYSFHSSVVVFFFIIYHDYYYYFYFLLCPFFTSAVLYRYLNMSKFICALSWTLDCFIFELECLFFSCACCRCKRSCSCSGIAPNFFIPSRFIFFNMLFLDVSTKNRDRIAHGIESIANVMNQHCNSRDFIFDCVTLFNKLLATSRGDTTVRDIARSGALEPCIVSLHQYIEDKEMVTLNLQLIEKLSEDRLCHHLSLFNHFRHFPWSFFVISV